MTDGGVRDYIPESQSWSVWVGVRCRWSSTRYSSVCSVSLAVGLFLFVTYPNPSKSEETDQPQHRHHEQAPEHSSSVPVVSMRVLEGVGRWLSEGARRSVDGMWIVGGVSNASEDT